MQAFVEWHSKEFPGRTLYAVGVSIGGAVVIDTVHRNPTLFSKMVVVNTFTSLPDLVPEILFITSPIASLLENQWMSKAKIDQSLRHIEMLFVRSAQDTLVNYRHSAVLYNLAVNAGCKAILETQPDTGHNNFRGETTFKFLNDYLNAGVTDTLQ
jgi:pimeloyl-ACP methyl ester carboxylesterase